ncbi:hypothetical protein K1X84_03095 [bacterium]|nr:hypothetical protein [bacterium]
MSAITDRLKGGDRRSIGRSNRIVEEILKHPEKISELFTAVMSEDPLLKMRAADALEKITAKYPDWLEPYKHVLLHSIAPIEQHEVRWHVALMLSYVKWNSVETRRIIKLLIGWFQSERKSNIVRVNCLQAMANLAQSKPKLIKLVQPVIEKALKVGSPAVKARCRKIITAMKKSG